MHWIYYTSKNLASRLWRVPNESSTEIQFYSIFCWSLENLKKIEKVFFLKKENILASLEKCVKMQIPILIFRMIKEYLFESGTTSFLLLIVSVYSRRREFSSFFRTRCHVKALLTLTFLYISRICAGCRFQKSNSEVL